MPACPLSKGKSSNWLLRQMLRCMPGWYHHLCWSHDIKEVHAHYVPTANTVKHSLLKMDLCSVDQPQSSLHQKGRRSLVSTPIILRHCQNNSCLSMVVSSGLVSTRPLRKLFSNVKHAWDFRPRMLIHHSHQHLHLYTPWQIYASDISIWMVWITSSLLISIPR